MANGDGHLDEPCFMNDAATRVREGHAHGQLQVRSPTREGFVRSPKPFFLDLDRGMPAGRRTWIEFEKSIVHGDAALAGVSSLLDRDERHRPGIRSQ